MASRRSSSAKQRPSPKRWLFHGILSDIPISTEDEYFSEREILVMLQGHDLLSGIRISNLRLTPLPERKKKLSPTAEKQQATPENPLTNTPRPTIIKDASKEAKP